MMNKDNRNDKIRKIDKERSYIQLMCSTCRRTGSRKL